MAEGGHRRHSYTHDHRGIQEPLPDYKYKQPRYQFLGHTWDPHRGTVNHIHVLDTYLLPKLNAWNKSVKEFKKANHIEVDTAKQELDYILSDMLNYVVSLKYHCHIPTELIKPKKVETIKADKSKKLRSYASDMILVKMDKWEKEINGFKTTKEKNYKAQTQKFEKIFTGIHGQVLEWQNHFCLENHETVGFPNQNGGMNQYQGQPQPTRKTEQHTAAPQNKDTKSTDDKYQVLLEKNQQLEERLESKSAMIREQSNEIDRQKTEIESLNEKIQSQKREMNDKTLHRRQAVQEKEEALTRLSEIASQKLRDNNPAITDLSTENRPTKIGEKFKEVYDNQWTDAFEELKGDKTEKEAIEILVKTLIASFKFTRSKAEMQLDHLKECTRMLAKSEQQGLASPKKLPSECTELLKQLLKASSPIHVEALQQEFLQMQTKSKNQGKRMNIFCQACIDVTWYMNIQMPPMFLHKGPNQNDPFPTDLYKPYTTSGNIVDYMVWPACLLHENGPLLTKGIAQPIKRDGGRTNEKETRNSPREDTEDKNKSGTNHKVGVSDAGKQMNSSMKDKNHDTKF